MSLYPRQASGEDGTLFTALEQSCCGIRPIAVQISPIRLMLAWRTVSGVAAEISDVR